MSVSRGKLSHFSMKTLEMGERKWEDLSSDCLVNIFGRLELESRLLDIPLVCKPWHRALLNPLCWQQLVFPSRIRYEGRIMKTPSALTKLVVKRSQRFATSLMLLNNCTREDLIYVSDECPGLKTLVLCMKVCFHHHAIIPDLIIKWKNLETLEGSYCTSEILTQISLHCKNFVGFFPQTGLPISNEEASLIVNIQSLKYLTLRYANIKKESLMLIMRGCKQLVHLDVRNCIGFDEDDDDILKLASVIKDFNCEGSRAEESDWDCCCGDLCI